MAVDSERFQPTRLPIDLIASPFVRFARTEAAGGIILLASTVLALIWANSPWRQVYYCIWHGNLSIGIGRFIISETRLQWIDDGLMAVFFFLIGLEIKRQVLVGELSSVGQALFPLLSALGGTVMPALIYLGINHGGIAQRGWAIPTATDIAFALGVLIMLGRRVPVSVRIFVTALAIVDDIIAIAVIAVFYTDKIDFMSVAIALGGIVLSILANVLGIRRPVVYALIGLVVWCAVLKSGVHATLAGVLLAVTIPARTYIDRDGFILRTRWLLERFDRAKAGSLEAQSAIHNLERQCELIESPLYRIEHLLQPWIAFLVMPLFALANAGVSLTGNVSEILRHPTYCGISLGLLIGKPLGISLFAWSSTRLGLGTLMPQVSWRQIFGASCLCGIGFTMSLFISTLAFGEGPLLDTAKVGILTASFLSGICGCIILSVKSR
jgi:Na+:H+ antiporter, NhaA family